MCSCQPQTPILPPPTPHPITGIFKPTYLNNNTYIPEEAQKECKDYFWIMLYKNFTNEFARIT